MEVDINKLEPVIDAERVIRIAEHYCHARRHDHLFANLVLRNDGKEYLAMYELTRIKARLVKRKIHSASHFLLLETKSLAVKKCYDAIAVILRMVDVIEGRQKLGKVGGEE